jgi:hypothetical protein
MTAPMVYPRLSSDELVTRWRELLEQPGLVQFEQARQLAGAREVIIVETTGRIRSFGSEGERAASALGLTLTLPAGTYPL